LRALEAALEERGLGLEGLRHLVLTHIHLDHAGAAGVIARANPALRIHVSEIGAPHLVDPSRLERSARRLYQNFDELWGELAPVPEEAIDVVRDRVLDLEAWPTPGHASHHVSYLAADGTCFAGDATGVKIPPSRFLAPVSPPPDIDLEAWDRTLESIGSRAPDRLCLPHFGVIEDPDSHLREMRERLRAWAERVRDGATEEEFIVAAEQELAENADADTAAAYTQAGPFWQSYAGLARYWDKRREAVADHRSLA
jgi:glyoxylase-like metal-dependent hydrolase (beta-lactamase superfamily II)